MAYDNMRVAVKKFLGQEREHTDALRRMELHYCCTPHFPQLVDTGFQVLFHSPPGVLFTFPSQYYALSVTE